VFRRAALLFIPLMLPAQETSVDRLYREWQMRQLKQASNTSTERMVAQIQEQELQKRVNEFVAAWKAHVDKLNSGLRDLKTRKEVRKAFDKLDQTEGW
jgi:hypothetical protein